MKLCLPHWNQLKEAIEATGLSKYVAPDGKAAIRNLVGGLEGKPERDVFDPLMAANLAIWSNALDKGGLYMMTGDYCPICESEKAGYRKADWWIEHAVNDQIQVAQELGYFPADEEKPQSSDCQ